MTNPFAVPAIRDVMRQHNATMAARVVAELQIRELVEITEDDGRAVHWMRRCGYPPDPTPSQLEQLRAVATREIARAVAFLKETERS